MISRPSGRIRLRRDDGTLWGGNVENHRRTDTLNHPQLGGDAGRFPHRATTYTRLPHPPKKQCSCFDNRFSPIELKFERQFSISYKLRRVLDAAPPSSISAMNEPMMAVQPCFSKPVRRNPSISLPSSRVPYSRPLRSSDT